MPYSLVMQCVTENDLPISLTKGPKLHGLFMNLINQADSEIAQEIHDSQGLKPFTLSPFRWNGKEAVIENGRLKEGTECWFRITLLKDQLFESISKMMLKGTPRLQLGDRNLILTRMLSTPGSNNPWANFQSYIEIISATSSKRTIPMEFHSATTFRQRDLDMPLPIPRLVFQSYLSKWNAFMPAALFTSRSVLVLSEELLDLVEQHLAVSFCQISTVAIRDVRSLTVGFKGSCSFRFVGRVPDKYVWQINILANYGYYAGTGRKTTMGMGMTRRIDD